MPDTVDPDAMDSACAKLDAVCKRMDRLAQRFDALESDCAEERVAKRASE